MKRERKIFLWAIFGLYAFFAGFRVLLFPNMGAIWHLESSVFGLLSLGLTYVTIRLVDKMLDRIYPYERDIIVRLLIQFAMSLLIIFSIRSLYFPFLMHRAPVLFTRELYAAVTAAHILFIATIILTMFGFRFFNKWRETELKKEILEREKATVQYDNLKNQLNPHFLFNSLTSLNSLIFENPQLAAEFLQQLSKVYRYVLENNDKTLVTLSTEIKFISNYIKLLDARFENGLFINIETGETAAEKKILPVTLQILVENAIKHNILSKDSPLRIDIYDESDYLIVKNNLQIKHTIEDSNKQGLENLKNLYKVLIEKEIIIQQSPAHFLVKIPLI